MAMENRNQLWITLSEYIDIIDSGENQKPIQIKAEFLQYFLLMPQEDRSIFYSNVHRVFSIINIVLFIYDEWFFYVKLSVLVSKFYL